MKTFDELFEKADRMIKTFVQSGGGRQEGANHLPHGKIRDAGQTYLK